MLTRKIIAGMVLFILVYGGIARGTTYYVDENGSDEANGLSWATAFATIQKGIDSNDCDIVEVNEGTYYGSVDFNGTACTVTSKDPNDWDVVAATAVDGNGAGTGVLFTTSEGSDSVLTGFTVEGASYGISCGSNARPVINKCIIRNNTVRGIYCASGSPTISNNKIYSNGFYNIHLSGSAAGTTVSNNIICDANYGMHIVMPLGVINITNNTLVGNKIRGISKAGGTIYPTITNCIIWDCNDDLYGCSTTYSCIQDGDSGTGNISSYPYFTDYDANDFHLTWNSPCINKGADGNYAGQTDIDNEDRVIDGRVDMGADELNTNFPNLVKNPGFEIVDGNGNPSYWSFEPWGTETLEANDSPSGTGNSWRFDYDTYSNYYCRGVSNLTFEVESGKYYKLSGWVKGTSDPNHLYLSWMEYDANGTELPYDHCYYAIQDAKPTKWTSYCGGWLVENKSTKYLKIKLTGPFGCPGTVWWDDISLNEIGTLYLLPYGCINEPNLAETVKFGENGLNEGFVAGTITNYMSEPYTDSNDENVTYRELNAGKTLTVEFPAFNVDTDDYNCPNSPMLLEIMFKDTIGTSLVSVYSKVDYVDLDPNYQQWSSSQDYYLSYLGGLNDYNWKYIQYGFQKSHYQLLRAINGKFTIKIKNESGVNLPIDYISLRKISQQEYEAISNKQRSLIGFYDVNLPADASSASDYDELTVFVRDIMRPVYKHTKPEVNEPNRITAFSMWGEIEPMSFALYSKATNGDINNISVTVSNLTCEDGNIIDGNEISIYEVVYDESRLNYLTPKGYALQPDRLEEFASLSIDPNTSKRVWMKVQVPDANKGLSAGLYEGRVTISRPNKPNIYIPIDFTVYNITLDRPAATNPVASGPYSRIYSSDMDVVFEAYTETGFDPFECPVNHYIRAYYNNGTWTFDNTKFKQAVQRMVAEGYAKDTIIVWIQNGNILQYTSDLYPNYDPNLYFSLSEPNFKTGFGLYVEEHINSIHSVDPNITVQFFVVDEPGTNPRSRIFADRLFNIIHDHNGLTAETYFTTCDDPLYIKPYDKVSNTGYNIDPNLNCWLPALTDLVDYKVWAMEHAHVGYRRHKDPNDPNHSTIDDYFGYYTTGHSHYRNPVYNRFLHGLFAFRTDAAEVWAAFMGSYPFYFSDPYNDFDVMKSLHYIYSYPYPDFLFAYPTWGGELLYTIGGLEGIREGIKDARYVATLKNLISNDPNNFVAQTAQGYLNEVESGIDPNYTAAYSNQYTELGYYEAILEDVNDANDYEAFTRIRKDIAEYIVKLSSLASEPSPADEAIDVSTDATISWTGGKCALSYDVYLGTDYDDVNDANKSSSEYKVSQDSNSFEPDILDYNTTYYWRIDSNSLGGTAKGNVWSFTTVEPPPVGIIGSWGTGLTHTKESGSNRTLVLIAHVEEAGAITLNSVTYGGQAMTKVVDKITGTNPTAYVAAYVLNEAGVDAATSGTFVPSWSTTPDNVSYASVFLENVDQDDIVGALASNSGTSTPDPITTGPLPTNDGDMVIDAATCGNAGSYTLNGGFTEGTDQQMASSTGVTGYKSATGAAETPSADYSSTVNRQVIIGFVVRATGSPPPVCIAGSWGTGTSHTKESGSNRALVLIAHAEENGTATLDSVTYGGQSMTKVVEKNVNSSGYSAYVAAYILDEDGIEAATNSTFAPTWSTTPDNVSYSSVFLENVDQNDILGAVDSNSTAGSTPNPIMAGALSTDGGDIVIDAATCGNTGNYTMNSGFTEAVENDMASSTGTAGYKYVTGADETPSAQHTNVNRQVIIGFVVRH